MPKVKTNGAASKVDNSSAKAGPSRPTYAGFTAFPLAFPGATSKKSVTHTLYVRLHAPKATDGNAEGKTLFIVNLPVDITERQMRTMFGAWGTVDTVKFGYAGGGESVLGKAVAGLAAEEQGLELSDSEEDEDEDEEEEAATEVVEGAAEPTFVSTMPNPKSRAGRKARHANRASKVVPLPTVTPLDLSVRSTPLRPESCHLTFLSSLSASRVISHPPTQPVAVPASEELVGLAYYSAKYAAARPSLATARSHADTSVALHDELLSRTLAARAKTRGNGALVDEDGFTVVVRSGKYGRTGGKGEQGVAVAARAAPAPGKKKSAGSEGLEGFYKFQRIEKKRQGPYCCP
jgi:ribosomal RNA-processing protein 7